MTTPEFDDEGYPTEATLQALREWPYPDPSGALDFMAAAWHWPQYVSRELRPSEAEVVYAEPTDSFLRLATGGWSGNEDLISAFAENLNYMLTWQLSGRGGLHIFNYFLVAQSESGEAISVPMD